MAFSGPVRFRWIHRSEWANPQGLFGRSAWLIRTIDLTGFKAPGVRPCP